MKIKEIKKKLEGLSKPKPKWMDIQDGMDNNEVDVIVTSNGGLNFDHFKI